MYSFYLVDLDALGFALISCIIPFSPNEYILSSGKIQPFFDAYSLSLLNLQQYISSINLEDIQGESSF